VLDVAAAAHAHQRRQRQQLDAVGVGQADRRGEPPEEAQRLGVASAPPGRDGARDDDPETGDERLAQQG